MTKKIAAFRKTVLGFYEKNGRKTLPWRLNTGAWPVLVSECMLQQTQVDRVTAYWERWLARWPLAAARSSSVGTDSVFSGASADHIKAHPNTSGPSRLRALRTVP